tara:strand:+ start:2402 stop:3151 length:750 start_codon:yes stop_codon:yes gene_type:complete
MASLLGKNINETYEGLLKTFDNNSLSPSNTIRITDGVGNCTALSLGTGENASIFHCSLSLCNTLLVNNDITTNDNICVKGNATVDNDLIVTGDTITTGLIGTNFKLKGTGTFDGAITFNNTICVSGISNLSDTNINGDLTVTGTISSTEDIIAFASSDNRLKDNLTPIQSSNYINNLTGYEFDWNDKSKRTGKGKGIVAQDLYKIDKSLVHETNDGYLSVDYTGLIPVLIEEVKRLGKEIEEIKKLQSP